MSKNDKSIQHDLVVQGRARGDSWRTIRDEIENETGVQLSIDGLRGSSRRRGWTKEADSVLSGNRYIKTKFDKNQGSVTTRSLDLRTVEDVLEFADVDTDIWEVTSQEITSNDVTMGAKTSGDGQPATFTNYRIFVRLGRIKGEEKDLREVLLEKLVEELKKTKFKKTKDLWQGEREDVVMFMGLFDHHFGKLCWAAETGTDYDLKIAYAAFIQAVRDLLRRAQAYGITKIVFPVGNDFFQIDNFIDGKIGATTKGTPQDTDGRLAKIFNTGMLAMIEAVHMCAQVAPVEVIYVPGNHDWNTSFYLTKIIEQRFMDDDRVEVDASPIPRKYRRYGKVLIGLTHGNEEKHADLPTIMAGEAKKDWAEADDYMWFLGHFHRRKEMRFNAGDTHGAVQIRILPSLSGTDAWHHKRGYVKNARAAEAYFFHPTEGYIGHVAVKLRPELMGEAE